MNLMSEILLVILTRFANVIMFFYGVMARFFGYPINPGMLIDKPDAITTFFEPSEYSRYEPPLDISRFPFNWYETLFSKSPPLANIPKFFYQSETDGFYSFYIDLYSNNYFLPDWLSKWLQLTFNIYFDTTNLQSIQEGIFIFLLIYMQFIAFRVSLFWFITINPFVRPWIYLTSLVDWAYDITAGIVPGLFGVDIGVVLFFSVIGKLIDITNSLIFTMPFLPSEGEIDLLEKNSINSVNYPDYAFLSSSEESKNVIFFRYLPRLWYTHPIPNDIREFWFQQRPDILDYMIKNYQQLQINFYPDNIFEYLEKFNISIDDFNNVYFNNIQMLDISNPPIHI